MSEFTIEIDKIILEGNSIGAIPHTFKVLDSDLPMCRAKVTRFIRIDKDGILQFRARADDQYDVLLKIPEHRESSAADHSTHLEREGKMYGDRLKNLQGEAIPKCYGLYRNEEEEKSCLVLGYHDPIRNDLILEDLEIEGR
jgi:hypothetical protein